MVGQWQDIDRLDRVGDRAVGTFSNLGSWDVASDPWIGFFPVSRASPFGAAAGTINGRMSYCLKSYRTLGLLECDLKRILFRWTALALHGPNQNQERFLAGLDQ